MKIKTTKNYKMFSYLPGNRKIIPKHVDNMVKSIKTMGIIRPVVIGKTTIDSTGEKKFVIDGQHLGEGCVRLGLSVPYIEITVDSIEDMVVKMGMLNTTSKSWTLGNFVDAYMTLPTKYIPYEKIYSLRKTYNIEYSMLSALCSMNSNWDSPQGTKNLKEGKLEILNPQVETHVKDLKNLFDVIPGIEHNLKRKFVRCLISTGGHYDIEKVLINTKKHLKTLELMSSEDKSLDFIQEKIFELKLNQKLSKSGRS